MNHTKLIILLFVVSFLTSTLFFVGCGKTEEKDIKIGAILPLTGKNAELGNNIKAGLILASEELTKSSNHRFNIIFEDNQSEPKIAINAYNKLRSTNNINIFLITLSGISLAIKPIIIKDNKLLLSIASHPKITSDNSNNVLRPCNSSTDECKILANYLKTKDSIKNKDTWVLYFNSEFGNSFNTEIKELLGEFYIGAESFGDKIEEYKSIIIPILSKKPSNLIVIGFTPNMGILIKTLREFGYKGNIFTNIGFTDESIISSAGVAAKGVYYVDYDFPFESEFGRNMDELSMKRFNSKFRAFSFLSYYAVKILNAVLIQEKSLDVNVIVNNIKTRKNIMIDNIEFICTSNGDIIPPLCIKRY